MSVYDQGSRQAETQQQRDKGIEAFLSQEERQQLQRMLGFPEEFPRSFGAWIADYIAVNGLEIPISQVRGFTQFKASYHQVSTGGYQATSSTAYGDLSTVGPTISGLSDGQYIVLLGAAIEMATAGNFGYASISVNGSSPVDVDAVFSSSNQSTSGCRAVLVTMENANNNQIRMKYRTGVGSNEARFYERWILALKIGN